MLLLFILNSANIVVSSNDVDPAEKVVEIVLSYKRCIGFFMKKAKLNVIFVAFSSSHINLHSSSRQLPRITSNCHHESYWTHMNRSSICHGMILSRSGRYRSHYGRGRWKCGHRKRRWRACWRRGAFGGTAPRSPGSCRCTPCTPRAPRSPAPRTRRWTNPLSLPPPLLRAPLLPFLFKNRISEDRDQEFLDSIAFGFFLDQIVVLLGGGGWVVGAGKGSKPFGFGKRNAKQRSCIISATTVIARSCGACFGPTANSSLEHPFLNHV